MRILLLLSLLTTALAQRTCSEPSLIKEGMPIGVSAPQFVAPSAKFTLVVNFEGGTNGCAQAHSLVIEGDTLQVVKAYYTQEQVEGQLCATVIPVHELSMEIQAPPKGLVRFVDGNGKELGRTTVREPLAK